MLVRRKKLNKNEALREDSNSGSFVDCHMPMPELSCDRDWMNHKI
jgi:hypothetical protein